MSTWVGYLVFMGEKVEMIFTAVELNEHTGNFTAVGNDRYGSFNFQGSIQDKVFRAIKHYPSWDIYYKGNYEREKKEIYGFWGQTEEQPMEQFKIMKIKNEEIPSFQQIFEHPIIAELD
jgi:hypothetical protein